IINYAIRNVAVEGLQVMNEEIVPVQLEGNKGLVLLLQLQKHNEIDYKDLLKKCNELITFCKENLYCDVCFYIGEEVETCHVFEIVRQLIEIDKNNFVHMNQTFTVEDWIQQPANMPEVAWESWLKLMKARDEKLLLQHINQYFAVWR